MICRITSTATSCRVDKPVQRRVLPNDRPSRSSVRRRPSRMGLLSTTFMAAFMLLAPLFGRLADRMSRWKLMAFGVSVWSLASGASGLAFGYVTMFLRGAWSAAERRLTGRQRRRSFPPLPQAAADGPGAPPLPRSRGQCSRLALGGLMLWSPATPGWGPFRGRAAASVAGPALPVRASTQARPVHPAAQPHTASWRDYLIIPNPILPACSSRHGGDSLPSVASATGCPPIRDRASQPHPATASAAASWSCPAPPRPLAGGWVGDALAPLSRLLLPGAPRACPGLPADARLPCHAPFPWAYIS